MSKSNQARETEKVIKRVLKAVPKYDGIGKAEFEAILHKIMQQVEKNTGIEPDKSSARPTKSSRTCPANMAD